MGGRQQGCCLSGGQGSGGIEFRKEVGRRAEAGVCKDSCVTDRTCTECAPGLTYFLSEGQLLLCGVQRKQGGGCRETTARASTGHPLSFLDFLLWGQGSCLCLLQVGSDGFLLGLSGSTPQNPRSASALSIAYGDGTWAVSLGLF